MSTALATASEESKVPVDVLEALLGGGDLSKLSAQQKADYLLGLCKSLGLNALSRPIEFISLQGKTVPYVSRGACDQLRRIHSVSFDPDVRTETIDGVMTKTVVARMPDGRTDVECGAVVIAGLKGADMANASMRCLTKAKRRATLSIVGLGWLSEDELDTVNVQPAKADTRKPLSAAPVEALDPAPANDDELTSAELEQLHLAADMFEAATSLKELTATAAQVKKIMPEKLLLNLNAPYMKRKEELKNAKPSV